MQYRRKLPVLLLGMVGGALCCCLPPARSEPPKADEPILKKFMRAKLVASNQVLEGLCTEDYALIAAGAQKLGDMSKEEKWRVSNDVMYRQHSAEFQRIVGQLEKSAKQRDLDAAALTWIEATMNCIECHKHARAILVAKP